MSLRKFAVSWRGPSYSPSLPMASTGQPSIASLQKCLFLRGLWLFQHLGVTTIVVARKISRRGLATKVAIDALVIHVKPPSHILRIPVCNVSHIYSLSSSNPIFPRGSLATNSRKAFACSRSHCRVQLSTSSVTRILPNRLVPSLRPDTLIKTACIKISSRFR